MAFFSYSQNYDGFIDIVINNPDRYLPIVQFLDNILGQPSELSKAEKELIGAYVSTLNNCEFCYGVHEAMAKSFNVDKNILLALKTDIETAAIDSKIKAVLKLTHKVTTEPNRIVQSDIQSIVDSNWSEKTAEDVIAIASAYAFLNRLVDGFGIKGSSQYFAAISEGFSNYDGYEAFVRSTIEKGDVK